MTKKETDDVARESKGRGPGVKEAGEGFPDLMLPRWLAPVLYGAVTLLLFRKFVFSGSMLYGSDTLALGLVGVAQEAREGGPGHAGVRLVDDGDQPAP